MKCLIFITLISLNVYFDTLVYCFIVFYELQNSIQFHQNAPVYICKCRFEFVDSFFNCVYIILCNVDGIPGELTNSIIASGNILLI